MVPIEGDGEPDETGAGDGVDVDSAAVEDGAGTDDGGGGAGVDDGGGGTGVEDGGGGAGAEDGWGVGAGVDIEDTTAADENETSEKEDDSAGVEDSGAREDVELVAEAGGLNGSTETEEESEDDTTVGIAIFE